MKSYPQWIPQSWIKAPPHNLLFRVDAGNTYGLSYGHLFRSILLAEFAQERWATQVTFLTCSDTLALKYLTKHIANVQQIKSSHQSLLQTSNLDIFDWIVLDLPYRSFPFDSQCFQLTKIGKRVLLIDDVIFNPPSSISVYHNSGIIAEKKIVDRKEGIEYQIGPDFLIANLPEPKCPISESEPPRNILITFGGSDPSGLSIATSRLLNERFSDFPGVFTFVTGPGYTEHRQLNSSVETSLNQKTIANPVDLYKLMLENQMIICAGGRTLYEAYKLNLNIFSIPSIQHEVEVVAQFVKRGLLEHFQLSWDSEEFERVLRKATDWPCRSNTM